MSAMNPLSRVPVPDKGWAPKGERSVVLCLAATGNVRSMTRPSKQQILNQSCGLFDDTVATHLGRCSSIHRSIHPSARIFFPPQPGHTRNKRSRLPGRSAANHPGYYQIMGQPQFSFLFPPCFCPALPSRKPACPPDRPVPAGLCMLDKALGGYANTCQTVGSPGSYGRHRRA
ncbi:hypothetical protein, variant [Magnaporthiopsis poae ATCC 64411]|uniref:Uncharacterized protein n=1 Tax=Magnaporthiopsis poae (strain ATCC 64411 / 73-15) TaxID=644358 RepID=A0A0C4DW06_MAGP6|nr:hypothetical protein, variant [Magnaporthiopsis poae ATCC 64411]